MKKWMWVILSAYLVVFLVACTNTAEPKSGTEESKKSELTLEEVYKKAIDRQNEVESLSADMVMDQTIKVESEGFEMSTKSDVTMDVVVDPMAMYMNVGTTSMADSSTGEDINIKMKMYMVEEGLFMQDSETQSWTKLPTDDFEEIMGGAAQQVNAAEQLKELEAFIDEFKFEQTNNQYVLSLDAAGDKFSEYMLKELQDTMPELSLEDQSDLENMKFSKVNYVITIDKETFDIVTMDMVIDMVMNVEGQELVILSNTNINFKNFNEVKEINIPQEVIDQAVEIAY